MLFLKPLTYLQQDLEQPHLLERSSFLQSCPNSLSALSNASSRGLLHGLFSDLRSQSSLHPHLHPHLHISYSSLFYSSSIKVHFPNNVCYHSPKRHYFAYFLFNLSFGVTLLPSLLNQKLILLTK